MRPNWWPPSWVCPSAWPRAVCTRLSGWRKVDEMPFDFVRRRLSVVVADQQALLALYQQGRLQRDFIAAGDLLNWVLTKRGEDRVVQFVDAHRLVALFFGAMGINEQARVQVRKV